LTKNELKTLFNLGTEIKDLRKIFLLQGTLLSVFGGIIGLLLGIVIVTTAFSTGDDYPTLAYPVVFDRKRIDCYGNDNHSWLYRFTDCE
jgi:lipoprotein-releasing system permease protein